MTRVRVQERTYSRVYIDDRKKHKYAITVRHAASMEVMRFLTREAAEGQRDALKDQGYKPTKR